MLTMKNRLARLPPGGMDFVHARRARVFAVPVGMLFAPGIGTGMQTLLIICLIIVALCALYWVLKDLKKRE